MNTGEELQITIGVYYLDGTTGTDNDGGLLPQLPRALPLPVVSADTGEGQVSVTSLTFTTENRDVPQTVTITGQNDDLTDGDQAYTIDIGPASGSAEYEGQNGPSVSVTNVDNDIPG